MKTKNKIVMALICAQIQIFAHAANTNRYSIIENHPWKNEGANKNIAVSTQELGQRIAADFNEAKRKNPKVMLTFLGTIDSGSTILRPSARQVISSFNEKELAFEFLARIHGNQTEDIAKNHNISLTYDLGSEDDESSQTIVVYGVAKKISCTPIDCEYRVDPTYIKFAKSYAYTQSELEELSKAHAVDSEKLKQSQYWYSAKVDIDDYALKKDHWTLVRRINQGI